eukprot:CAMPEP_0115020760 /NCGR_PEP_ID=MMETSP0216-20121206/30394_1 /TAXON_ID=223996 /ORGANISM="Protocruzia adherens, Strain Boccale" /LENGTH=160 /DNA_ID=CAMNT_0002392809 /DNA_START=118 /DNA_END=600 /DNA_ORIENTATION=+
MYKTISTVFFFLIYSLTVSGDPGNESISAIVSQLDDMKMEILSNAAQLNPQGLESLKSDAMKFMLDLQTAESGAKEREKEATTNALLSQLGDIENKLRTEGSFFNLSALEMLGADTNSFKQDLIQAAMSHYVNATPAEQGMVATKLNEFKENRGNNVGSA